MEKAIIAKEELSLEEYVQKIKAKKIYHNELPEEIRDEIVIINAEVAAKMRQFEYRGYDVIRNRFFVHQSIKVKNYSGEIVDRDDVTTFELFDEYYNYLDGDIYESACYYQYIFSEDTMKKYDVDLSKISTLPFIKDTLSIRSKEQDKADKEEREELIQKAKRKRVSLLKWRDKFCACSDYDELVKVSKSFQRSSNNEWEYVLSSFALFNRQQNIPLVFQLLIESDHIKLEKLLPMLYIEYGDDSILDYFDSYHWKKKSELKSILKGIDDGSIVTVKKEYYDSSIGFFCIEINLVDDKATHFYNKYKARIVHYYDSFEEFVKACNYDLSNAYLPKSCLRGIDLSKYNVSYQSPIQLSDVEEPHYSVRKQYDYKKDIFCVVEEWRADSNSSVLKTRTYTFDYFVDFVAFLEGDLSNADLLLCDGLSFVTDFSQINLKGALLTSAIKEKAGLLDKGEILSLTTPDVIRDTESTELIYYDEGISPHQELTYEEQRNHKKIYYISDLHLPHRINAQNVRTREDVLDVIKKSAIELANGIYASDILVIVGDTSFDVSYFSIFIKMLREFTDAKVVFVLGNHELWGFDEVSFTDIVTAYKNILDNEGMYLLQNNILYSTSGLNPLQEITEEELITIDKSSLRERLKCAQIILFGGVGFSGLNQKFNANNGIYRKTIIRESEIKESNKFESLYTKVRNYLPDREVIVATHMPLNDWSHDVEYHGGYVYLSGHTHRNEFYDDGIKRVYADNQVGYYRKQIGVKSLYIEGKYDLFVDYIDGIYEITRSEYADFYRGKNIRMDFNRDFEHLYMLKRNGYYCFIIQTSKGKLSILNGGSTKAIKNKTIESCYEDMLEIVETIKSPLDAFTSIQKQISNFVKSIGGNGRIHGAIIDIDDFNHIYVNPNDLKITSYFALSIVEKIMFGSIQDLLTQCRPDLLPAYNNYLTVDASTALVLNKNTDNSFVSKPYYSTDIYRNSNILKKMQRLYSNILTIWPEKSDLHKTNLSNQKLLKDDLN